MDRDRLTSQPVYVRDGSRCQPLRSWNKRAMIEHAKETKIPGGTWGPPLVGFAGTVAGILIGFSRIGTEPQWKTVLVGVGCSVVGALGGACLMGLRWACGIVAHQLGVLSLRSHQAGSALASARFKLMSLFSNRVD
jgi:hypothetical protein